MVVGFGWSLMGVLFLFCLSMMLGIFWVGCLICPALVYLRAVMSQVGRLMVWALVFGFVRGMRLWRGVCFGVGEGGRNEAF
ncbi:MULTISPECIES: hypothetical protein [Corynebacterium]|jgi:hypothetical protein|uniref:hypothetical protein n=1 Tax=Corynebacterium TaxID=1716 RepID=UPI001EF7379B|nr:MULTISPECIES: hypothetical protein [Corynebacterium]MCG7232769.1 hypothetical protein [Corynebacterium sp. ACRPR]MCG7270656.1 hypothetical protein [Corynebacterium sp. ACRQM]MDK8660270.1 hypothetical protein [Corynebacterium sp. MSK204]WKS60331.1 hypothetical protein NLL43_11270 [Corynebacterium accolens]